MSDDNMQPKQEQWLTEEELEYVYGFQYDITTLNAFLTAKFGNPDDLVSKAEVDRIVEDALHSLKAQVARAVWTEWNRKMIPNERDTIIALILKLGITPSLAEREPSEPTPELRKEASDEASN